MKSLSTLFCLLFLFIATSSYGYVPSSNLILQRTGENHGSGLYIVEQDVVFFHKQEPLIVHETWYIEGASNMRLEVTGKHSLKGKISLVMIYDGKNVHYLDAKGKKKVKASGKYFTENFYHYRKPEAIKAVLVGLGIAPKEITRSDYGNWKPNQEKTRKEYFLRLSRLGGQVTYALGKPSQSGSSREPSLWVSQDLFELVKIRLSEDFEVTGRQFKKHSGGLLLPQVREYSYKDHKYQINVTHVKPIAKTNEIKTKMAPWALERKENKDLALQLTDEDEINNFYKLFR